MHPRIGACCADKASNIDWVTSVALAVVTASALLPTRAFPVHTVSAAFIVAGLARAAAAI